MYSWYRHQLMIKACIHGIDINSCYSQHPWYWQTNGIVTVQLLNHTLTRWPRVASMRDFVWFCVFLSFSVLSVHFSLFPSVALSFCLFLSVFVHLCLFRNLFGIGANIYAFRFSVYGMRDSFYLRNYKQGDKAWLSFYSVFFYKHPSSPLSPPF